MTNEDLSLD